MNVTRFIVETAAVVLAIIGLAWVLARVFDGIERAWGWLRRDRVQRLLKDPLCASCLGGAHCDGADEECICTCAWPENWAEEPLPPERTWEQMTSHQLPIADSGEREVHWRTGRCWCDEFHRDQGTTLALVERPGGVLAHLDDPRHERRVPWWETEARQAYAALELDYPSGMLARVRELAP